MWGCGITNLIAVHVVLCQPLNLSTYLTFSANGKKENPLLIIKSNTSLKVTHVSLDNHQWIKIKQVNPKCTSTETQSGFFLFKISYSYIVKPSGVLQAITERYL